MTPKRTYAPAEIVELLRAEAASARDVGARLLVDRWGGPLFSYLAKTLDLPEPDAADVLNAVLYRGILRIGQLRDAASLESWLYRMAYRAAVDWHRRSKRRREIPTEPSLIDLHAEPLDPWIGEEGTCKGEPRDEIQKALASLSRRDREVLSAVAHDLGNEEIAEMLSVTPAHARVLRHRAIERLRRAYARSAANGTVPRPDPNTTPEASEG
ncbi:MAG TPA: RNA polymerase sigma factor [Longimicrobium sp.]|jgi:RNA polymerase sigma-70 factor (ECF subfamily)